MKLPSIFKYLSLAKIRRVGLDPQSDRWLQQIPRLVDGRRPLNRNALSVAILEKTVGFFGPDPKLFLVHTPHFFMNPDPIEKNLGTIYQMPSEDEMFY